MRSIDKRVSTNIPNIFWKTKYKQINQIHQQVSFALRRNQSKGKTITAKILLNKETKQEIVKYNDGYRIFKNIRSSPPYFEHKRKDLMAMIRQLGIPTLFISLSAADTKWTQLLLRYDTIGRIELIPSIVLSSDNTNYKNIIQLFLQLFDELSVYRDCH